MNSFSEAVKLAVEKGGYKGALSNGVDYDFNPSEVALDPLFWIALGEALRWEAKQHPYCRISLLREYDASIAEDEDVVYKRIRPWQYHAHRYFESKLTGGDEEQFFNELLKGKA